MLPEESWTVLTDMQIGPFTHNNWHYIVSHLLHIILPPKIAISKWLRHMNGKNLNKAINKASNYLKQLIQIY